jgi:deoxyribonuclease V
MPDPVRHLAGVDSAYDKHRNVSFCAIVVFTYPALEIIDTYYVHDKIAYPYVPGLLAFREGPLFLKTYEKITHKPDLLIFDGQGIAHPVRWVLPHTWDFCCKKPQ